MAHGGRPRNAAGLVTRVVRRLARSLDRPSVAWLDGWPFWIWRVRRWIAGHHNALVEVTVAAAEAEAARRALEQRGWRHIATTPEDGPEAVLTFAVRTRSSSSVTASTSTLIRIAAVTLADQRIRSLKHVIVDPSLPEYQPRNEWRLSGGHPARVSTDSAAPAARSALAPYAEDGPADVAVVPSLTARVQGALRFAETAVERSPIGVAVIALAALGGVAAFVVTQLVASADPTPAGQGLYLWRAPSIWRALLLAGGPSAVLFLGILATRGRLRRALGYAASFAGAIMAGIILGGVIRGLFSIATVAGLAILGILAIVSWVWVVAGRNVWPWLGALLRLSAVVGVVIAFGRWRAVRYYAGMGLSAGDVDAPALDAMVLGIRPLFSAALVAAALIMLAWFASTRGVPLAGPALAVVAAATGVSLLLGTVTADEVRGRRVGVGIATLPAPGLRLNPAPTLVCLTSLTAQPDPDKPVLVGPLPRIMWKVGTLGQQTLLLDPGRARSDYPKLPTDPSHYAAHHPEQNVAAPIVYVPSNQVTLRRTGGDAC